MRKTRATAVLASLLLLVMVLADPLEIRAQEAERDFDSTMKFCRGFVKRKQWSQAIKAYEEMFARFADDPRPIHRIRVIEDDLKLCKFQLSSAAPDDRDAFGECFKSLKRGSRKISLNFPNGPTAPFWKQHGESVWMLDLKIEGDFTLRAQTRLATYQGAGRGGKPTGIISVIVCFDPEEDTGYLMSPGIESGVWGAPSRIMRLSDDGQKQLGYGDGATAGMQWLTVSRKGRKLRVQADYGKRLEAECRKFREGTMAFVGIKPSKITLEGKITTESLMDVRRRAESRAFLAWERENWSREKMLPKWVRTEVAERGEVHPAMLPGDAEPESRVEVGRALTSAVFGEPLALAAITVACDEQPYLTANYLRAAMMAGMGSFRKSDLCLCGVIDEAPAFHAARGLRGLVRLALGRDEDARADLIAARDKEPGSLFAHYGLAMLAIANGNLTEARKLLDAAEEAGVKCGRVEELRGLVHRTIAGPLWPKVYKEKSAHFEVMSDHSQKICRQVAHQLERAVESYKKYFRWRTERQSRSRVYVFASEAAYHRFATDKQADLEGSAGAYDPRMRELVLFIPETPAGFIHTVRHEGFHQFIHPRLPTMPIWFNEGCANYFAAGEQTKWGAGMTPGAPWKTGLFVLNELLDPGDELVPIEELCTLTHREFMANPLVHYAQAWAVVHYLRESGDDRMEKAFTAYAKALQEGASPGEAYASTLEPHAAKIEAGYRRLVKSEIRKLMR